MVENATSSDLREYVTFRIGAQSFCIDIMSVREIRGWTPATVLPRAPGYVKGVINLRGIVLPVVDLAERLGFAAAEPTPRHVIIVAQTRRQTIGLLVDAVSDVIVQPVNNVQTTLDVGSEATRSFIVGVMAINDHMVSLIALDSVMPNAAGEAA